MIEWRDIFWWKLNFCRRQFWIFHYVFIYIERDVSLIIWMIMKLNFYFFSRSLDFINYWCRTYLYLFMNNVNLREIAMAKDKNRIEGYKRKSLITNNKPLVQNAWTTIHPSDVIDTIVKMYAWYIPLSIYNYWSKSARGWRFKEGYRG